MQSEFNGRTCSSFHACVHSILKHNNGVSKDLQCWIVLEQSSATHSYDLSAIKATLTSDLLVERGIFLSLINKWSVTLHLTCLTSNCFDFSACVPPDLVPITFSFHWSWWLFLSPWGSICVIIGGPRHTSGDERFTPVNYKESDRMVPVSYYFFCY